MGGRFTHSGPGLGYEEEFGEGSVKRQQHSDAGRILAQAVFHGHEKLPQRPQQSQLTGSVGCKHIDSKTGREKASTERTRRKK